MAMKIRECSQTSVGLGGAESFKRLQGIADSVRTEQLRQALKGRRYNLEELLEDVSKGAASGSDGARD
ncbi:MAG TPA: hypothetical protein VF173_17925 [Thermoanaerobaculia bacterium]|nr:hypothetical protein [Thermoanaerobaculia bacterium]